MATDRVNMTSKLPVICQHVDDSYDCWGPIQHQQEQPILAPENEIVVKIVVKKRLLFMDTFPPNGQLNLPYSILTQQNLQYLQT